MAEGGENISEGFTLVKESQVTIRVQGSFDFAKGGSHQLILINLNTGQSTLVSKVAVEKPFNGNSSVGTTLRLPPSNYQWRSVLTSQLVNGMMNPVQMGVAEIYDDLSGIYPPGMLGPFTNSGVNNSFFLFSGITGRAISIKGVGNSRSALSGLLKLTDKTTGTELNSPLVKNGLKNSNGIWTEIAFFKIQRNHLYKVSFDIFYDNSELETFISLADNTP
jgi:hypothetical protein